MIDIAINGAGGFGREVAMLIKQMPAVNISREVELGEGVYIGTGAYIIHQREVGTSTTIGAGAVVTLSLPPHCTAIGVPARPKEFHQP